MTVHHADDGTGRVLDPPRRTNYMTDVRHIVGRVMGPNAFGEWMVVTAVDFDDDAGRSVANFVYATVEEVVAEAERRDVEERTYGAAQVGSL